MKLSTKGRYAVTALADIALQSTTVPVTLADIARRQGLSVSYLEQLFLKLRKGGIVESFRGPGGGYLLARDAAAICISEVMQAVDENLLATKCSGEVGRGCSGDKAQCLTHDLWEQLSAHVYLFLNKTTLADVISREIVPCPAVSDFTAALNQGEAHA